MVSTEEFELYQKQQKENKMNEREKSINVKGKKRKERLREENAKNPNKMPRKYTACCVDDCSNPGGLKCVWLRCRKCCKSLCLEKFLDCKHHSMAISRQLKKQDEATGPVEASA